MIDNLDRTRRIESIHFYRFTVRFVSTQVQEFFEVAAFGTRTSWLMAVSGEAVTLP